MKTLVFCHWARCPEGRTPHAQMGLNGYMKEQTLLKAVHFIERDPGLNWVKDPEVPLEPDRPLDLQGTVTPNVVRLSQGGFRMYYTSMDPAHSEQEPIGCILSAFSDDGVFWRKEPGVRMDVHEPDAMQRVLCPDVIPLPDGRWRMYFEAVAPNKPNVILSAVSDDGLNWQREEGIRVQSPACTFGSPRCLYMPSPEDPSNICYRLYFHHYPYPLRFSLDAQNHIISAVSEDGLYFEIESGVRVAQEDAQRESRGVYAAEVILLGDGSYRMYYSGWGLEIRGGIFAATSTDGLHWVKDPGPLLDLDRAMDCKMVSEPCVIELDDGRYRLYYEAQDSAGRGRILSATSG